MAKKQKHESKHEHEAAAGRKENRSEKHRKHESEGMKKAMKAKIACKK